MKKVITLLIFNTLLSFNLAAALFSGYDFTFFSSVAESIAISDSERIGFDYTGYGYFGDMTTGLFLRLGIQAPYSTLLYTLDDLVGNAHRVMEYMLKDDVGGYFLIAVPQDRIDFGFSGELPYEQRRFLLHSG